MMMMMMIMLIMGLIQGTFGASQGTFGATQGTFRRDSDDDDNRPTWAVSGLWGLWGGVRCIHINRVRTE
jgi:hypothetical protein